MEDKAWGREGEQRGMHDKANRGKKKQCEWNVGGNSSRGEEPRQRERQGHGKGGGWNIRRDRGESAQGRGQG